MEKRCWATERVQWRRISFNTTIVSARKYDQQKKQSQRPPCRTVQFALIVEKHNQSIAAKDHLQPFSSKNCDASVKAAQNLRLVVANHCQINALTQPIERPNADNLLKASEVTMPLPAKCLQEVFFHLAP